MRFIAAEGSLQEKPLAEIQHEYRSIAEFEERYIVSAVLKGHPAPIADIDAGLEASRIKRRTSQPIGASAGCMFKNPELCGAGKLVDELGLKGKRVGQVIVSQVHGNFFVNHGATKAQDIRALIQWVQKTVKEKQGVELELEIEVVGEW